MIIIGMQQTNASQMGDGHIVKMIGKAVNQIVKQGKESQGEGISVVQITPKNKLQVTYYLGNSSWESFGESANESEARILYVERYDADSPKFFRGLNLHGNDYRERTIQTIQEECESYIRKTLKQ